MNEKIKTLSNKNICIVTELLSIPFLKRPFDERLQIIKDGRPKPELPNLTKNYLGTSNSSRNFHVKYYERYEWLTGSEVKNKLFCWPCVLFEKADYPGKSHWATHGVSNLKSIQKIAYQHEISKAHHTNIVTFTNFVHFEEKTKKLIRVDSKMCVINLLLGYPFVDRPFNDQKQIFLSGRPTPPMPNLFSYDTQLKSRIGFRFELYIKYRWLTGSYKLNKLYCWSCLLFADTSLHEPFISTGLTQIDSIDLEAINHQSSDIHNENYRKYDDFKIILDKYKFEIEYKTEDDQDLPADYFSNDDINLYENSIENNAIEPSGINFENVSGMSNEDRNTTENVTYFDEEAISFEHKQLGEYIEEQFETSKEIKFRNYISTYENCIIKDLLQNHFTKKTETEQIKILQNGRPTPDMTHLSRVVTKYYQMFKWTAASQELNKLFCWCCLLFQDPLEKSLWTTEGFTDIRNIATRTRKHQNSKSHCSSVEKYNILANNLNVQVECVENQFTNRITTKLNLLNELIVANKKSKCIIVQLLQEKFNDRSSAAQVKIIKTGRPTPSLFKFSTLATKRNDSHSARCFHKIYYERYEWLAGSRPLNRLFCWFCLLNGSRSSWGTIGYTDMRHFTDSVKIHNYSKEHELSEQNFRKIGKTPEEIERETEENNKQKIVRNYLNENTSTCLINELLGYPFMDRSHKDQTVIIRNGRPMPKISVNVTLGIRKPFNANNYFRFKWLTASKKIRTFYCWYCLLFAEPTCNSTWVQTGFKNMRKFAERAAKHQISHMHKRNKQKYVNYLNEINVIEN